MQTNVKFLTVLILLIPAVALAAGPVAGTSDYLRSIGYTDEQLAGTATTEQRESFSISVGPNELTDPLGDVVDRKGGVASVNEPYGDIFQATLTKNPDAQAWDARVLVGGPIPETITKKIQLSFLIDVDGDSTNNAPGGVRIGTDAEFTIQTTPEHAWYTDFRWYNKDANFWAFNKETLSTFELSEDAITMHIPFDELSQDAAPSWRVVLAVANGEDSEIDVVPGIGFPPPKGETYPKPAEARSVGLSLAAKWIGLTAVILALSFASHKKLAKKRKK